MTFIPVAELLSLYDCTVRTFGPQGQTNVQSGDLIVSRDVERIYIRFATSQPTNTWGVVSGQMTEGPPNITDLRDAESIAQNIPPIELYVDTSASYCIGEWFIIANGAIPANAKNVIVTEVFLRRLKKWTGSRRRRKA